VLPAPGIAEAGSRFWEYSAWVGQVFYFSRFLIQWLASERSGRSETPRSFWWLSLLGALFGGAGAIGLHVWVLVPAFGINTGIYIRNLVLSHKRRLSSAAKLGPLPAALGGAVIAIIALWFGIENGSLNRDVPMLIFAIGIGGQAIWGSRFILQWWFSERKGRSHFPNTFWWISILGAFLNLAYTSQLGEPVFIVPYLIAWFVPARNLTLEYRRRRELHPL
jgi:lipid-A-disaccharide synthase-like uncharacterized protein